jgi:nucleotide-binding universal stress UspA family protein
MSNLNGTGGVVVGVDGSHASQVAVEWAARDASMRAVPLKLIHVLSPRAVMTWPEMPVRTGAEQWHKDLGREIIRDATAIAKGATRDRPIQIDGETVTGALVASLADLSKEAQVIVVGCHGRSRLRRMLGSVSTGLAQHAHCPVAIVHDDEPLTPDLANAPVVVGVDGSPASVSATAIAFDEASRRGVDMVAVHACMDWSGADYADMDWSDLEVRGHEVLAERLAGWQERYPDVMVRRAVFADQAARHLIEESEVAQLVVVGSHGRGGFAGMLLGSVGSAVAQVARIPVIIAREP